MENHAWLARTVRRLKSPSANVAMTDGGATQSPERNVLRASLSRLRHRVRQRVSSAMLATEVFWRLPHERRRQVFKRVSPDRAAYYQTLREARGGDYATAPMLDRKCLFVHIPKCAGVAINRALYGGLGGGHLEIKDYQLMFTAEEYASLFLFTVVRNPFDRLWSAYRFLKTGGLNIDDATWARRNLRHDGFNAFVEQWLTPARAMSTLHFRPQLSYLRIPGTTDIVVDFVARHETLASDFDYLRQRLGLIDIVLGTDNRSAIAGDDYRQAYSSTAREIASKVYADDLRVFGYSFDEPHAIR